MNKCKTVIKYYSGVDWYLKKSISDVPYDFNIAMSSLNAKDERKESNLIWTKENSLNKHFSGYKICVKFKLNLKIEGELTGTKFHYQPQIQTLNLL